MEYDLCHFYCRPDIKEQKIPYVRLERLKLCISEAGELPVFKLQPQDNEQEGNFLLIIECGTQSSSLSIKVSGISLRLYLLFSPLSPWLVPTVSKYNYTLKKS